MIVASIYQAVIKTSGGLPTEEAENAIKLYPILSSYYNASHIPNRNSGIVGFTEKEQEGILSWSEGNIKLYLEEEKFKFNVYTSYDVEFDREDYEHLIKEWFNTENADDVTTEQIVDYCTNNLPTFDDARYHSINDIDSLLATFEDNAILYDADENIIIYKIYQKAGAYLCQ